MVTNVRVVAIWTRRIVVAIVAGMLAIDLVLWAIGGVESTFSRVIYRDSQVSPLLPFLFGCLFWHLFVAKRGKHG